MSFSYPLALLLIFSLPLFLWLGRPRGVWARGRAWAAFALRALIVILLSLALAGTQIKQSSNRLSVVFLVDASDSVSPQALESARQLADDTIAQMQPDDSAAIIVFGSDALVERPMSGSKDVGPIQSQVISINTNLAGAIRLGMALFPPGSARRMVILSDGLANVGDAEAAARLAAASGIQIVAVPSTVVQGSEVLVTGVDAPTRLNEGQTFNLDVTIEASAQTNGILRVIAGSQVVVEEAVALNVGINRYTFNLTANQPGLSSFRVQVVPEGNDTFYQNNELSAFTQVVGPPRVLIVADEPSEAVNIATALDQQGLQVEQTSGGGLPDDLATLSNYQAIVLVNVSAVSLGPNKTRTLQTYVRDLGGGLVVVGGPHSYAVGGYFQTPLEETLPVDMQLKDQERLPQLTVVYVIDKSGSMSDVSVGGFQKVELAKEAIIRSVSLLGPLDRVGVVALDENATWVVDLGPITDKNDIARRVATIRADGGTDIYAGVFAVSQVLPNDPSQLKHIVLLTDGGASEAGVPETVKKMYDEAGITFSVIAIGQGYATWIEKLPLIADGRFHYAFNVDTIPEIFTEETVIATRAYIIEHEFFPTLTASSPILTGIEGTPPLLGYVGTTIKPTAQQILATNLDDPLLAAWQYGLGRSVAFTSDASGRWATDWVTWPSFAQFWSQAVRWTITEGVNQNVQVRVEQSGDTATITVDAQTDDGEYLNGLDMTASVVSPNLETLPLDLHQVAPGRYEGTFKPEEQGAYFVRVAGSDPLAPGSGQSALAQTSGWVLSYSPEYRSFEGDPNYLAFISSLTGGSLVDNPQSIFAHNLKVEDASMPIWPWLLLAATLILPFDIAVRRLILTRTDFARMAAWLGLRPAVSEPSKVGASRVGSLLAVKERVPRDSAPTLPVKRPLASPTEQQAADKTEAATPTQRVSPKPSSQKGTSGAATAASLLKSKRERRDDPPQR